MNDQDHDHLNQVFSKWQGSREHGGEEEQKRILEHIRVNHPESNDTSVKDVDGHEVEKIYHAWKYRRDPHRKQVMNTVLAAARNQVKVTNPADEIAHDLQSTKESTPSRMSLLLTAPWRWLDSIKKDITEKAGEFSMPGGALTYAIPALAVVALAVSLVLRQPMITEDFNQQTIAAGAPIELINAVPRLAELLEPAPTSQFGFSTSFSEEQSGFSQGVASMNLLISAHYGESALLKRNLQRLRTQLGTDIQPALSSQLDSVESAIDHENRDTRLKQTLTLLSALESRPTAQPGSLFELGKWVQVTWLNASITENKGGFQSLSNQLALMPELDSSVASALPVPAIRFIDELRELQTTVIDQTSIHQIIQLLSRLKTILG